MPLISEVEARLRGAPQRWLVTGAAGFIGSHLVQRLLEWGQSVVGLDNLSTGHRRNLTEAVALAGDGAQGRFRFIEGDCTDDKAVAAACEGQDFVLHQAALGSVPRSLKEPLKTHRSNVDGFIQVLQGARLASVKRFVYASSSSVYGDDPGLPKVEERTGKVLSPYAATKAINELYADVFQRSYGLACVGLRYFNVFGPRQDPDGPYAAVIPRWTAALVEGRPTEIYGDGSTGRDFCFVANAVQANLLAAVGTATGVFNVALGGRTTLLELHGLLRGAVGRVVPGAMQAMPELKPFRPGDIRDSQARIERARAELGYRPTHSVEQGVLATVDAFVAARGGRS